MITSTNAMLIQASLKLMKSLSITCTMPVMRMRRERRAGHLRHHFEVQLVHEQQVARVLHPQRERERDRERERRAEADDRRADVQEQRDRVEVEGRNHGRDITWRAGPSSTGSSMIESAPACSSSSRPPMPPGDADARDAVRVRADDVERPVADHHRVRGAERLERAGDRLRLGLAAGVERRAGDDREVLAQAHARRAAARRSGAVWTWRPPSGPSSAATASAMPGGTVVSVERDRRVVLAVGGDQRVDQRGVGREVEQLARNRPSAAGRCRAAAPPA